MTERITKEMRQELRKPLPSEAVSQHPTKTFLSSIKSIYVAERINDVFGVGSWTLKSEVVERLEKFAVVKAILEIPNYGFYGEAYGGNDNPDIGDAYKGATTDGFTKIAGQQLEIGIDVFKGLSTEKTKSKAMTKVSPEPTESKSTPLKEEVGGNPPEETEWPPLKNLGELYTRAKTYGLSPRDICSAADVGKGEDIIDYDKAWIVTATKFAVAIKAVQAAT